MIHDTVGNREKTEVAIEVENENPRVNVNSAAQVSLQCDICPFKTAELKQSKARQSLSNHHCSSHPLVNITHDKVGHNKTAQVAMEAVYEDSRETAYPTTVFIQDSQIETKQGLTTPFQPPILTYTEYRSILILRGGTQQHA